MRLDVAKRRERRRDCNIAIDIVHGSVECEAIPFGLVNEPKEYWPGARRTEPCLAPRHAMQ